MSGSGKGSSGAPPGIGERVGRYRVRHALGMGGMASVYYATAPDDTPVALKILHPASVLPDEVKRFTREFAALSRMDHPNIVKVYEAGVSDRFPWIAMEYVDGEDVGKQIEKWEQDPPVDRFEQSEQILRGLCKGLQYVHDMGLIHRDLKPTNVLLTKEGQPKISDFGVVKDPDATGTQLTKAGRLVGTVAFMAPEQITGEQVDRRADLYSLGAVLYMMLTFQRPIEAKTVAGYLARHLTEVPKGPAEYFPSLPPRLEQVCMRLLAKEPAQRYATAQAVLQALDRSPDEDRPALRGRDELLLEWGKWLGSLANGEGGSYAVVGPPSSGRSYALHWMAESAETRGLGVTRVSADEVPNLPDLPNAAGHVVVADDLDLAPRENVALLARYVRQHAAVDGKPLLLLFSAAEIDGIAAGVATGTATGMRSHVHQLQPLDRKSVITMMRDRGITGAAAPILGRRLDDELEGMPGAIAEQLDTLFDEGWLRRLGDSVVIERDNDALRNVPFPVPPRVRRSLEAKLDALDEEGRSLMQILAILGRPGPAALLERCVDDPESAPRTLDQLVRIGLLRRRDDEGSEIIVLAHPAAESVIRDRLDEDQKKNLHARIAQVLSSRRRRDAAKEIAGHLLGSGDLSGAYPMFVRAARRAARAGRFMEVLEICATGQEIRRTIEPDMSPDDAARYRRWLYMLEGEAQLARGRWNDALAPLEFAVTSARIEGDRAALGRCLGSLGRAHYRRGRFSQAEPLLEEALACAEAGAPERATATRALADIRLRAGDLVTAEKLWNEGLTIAVEMASQDGEARARRGLSHVRVMQNRLLEAADLLDSAEELLKYGGDDRVRAGVMLRSIELDITAGRYASGLHRVEALVELVHSREMSERLPDVFAHQAEVLMALGDRTAAMARASEALTYAQAQTDSAWKSRLRIARVLCDGRAFDRCAAALPQPEDLPTSGVDDPSAQLAVLRARVHATDRALQARDLARWALVRPLPLLRFRGALIALDAAKALYRAGDLSNARTAAKHGLKALDGPALDGLRLELLLVLHTVTSDERVRVAAVQVATRIADTLPTKLAAQFTARPEVATALRGTPSP